MNQKERAQLFASLHVKGDPLVLYNAWDAGSAKAVQDAGAKAIATGSWAVAAAAGYTDGEKLPLEAALANLDRILASVDLPVTLDFESGYAADAAEVAANVAKVIQAGAVGINFEDQVVGGEGLYSIEEQSARIKAVRGAAEKAGVPFFINARTDIFLKLAAADHTDQHLDEAIQRAKAYAAAGGSGFFAPGLVNPTYIEQLCNASSLPVNIMMFPEVPPPRQLAKLGVARISYGAGPYRYAMNAVKEAARHALTLPEA